MNRLRASNVATALPSQVSAGSARAAADCHGTAVVPLRRPSRRYFLAALALLLACASFLPAATNYVWPASPSPAFPYTSWETAAHSLHIALTAAAPFNTILVTNGVYTGNMGGSYGDTVMVVISSRYVQSVNRHGAIIDGQNTRRCAAIVQGSTLDGFQFINGRATRTGQTPNIAGGVACYQGGAVLNCIISNNVAQVATAYVFFSLPGYCGGIVCNGAGLVSNCLIVRNIAYGYGGGVVCSNGGTIIDCVIAGNVATNNSAGAFLWYGGLVTNCLIVNNSVTNLGGGVVCERGGTVAGCSIAGNRAGGYDAAGGGAVCFRGGTIRACVISNNSAYTAGGAYLMYHGLVEDCLITNNTTFWDGAGVRFYYGGLCRRSRIIGNHTDGRGGGVFFSRTGVVQNCLIAYNSAPNEKGGGILFYSGNLSQLGYAESCTITANASPLGGGVYFDERDSGIGGCMTNCIIYGNTGYDVGNLHMARAGFCCSATNLPGAGNIATNPAFMAAAAADFRLQNGSPCINVGTNLPWMTGATDLAGNPRIYFGIVDIGCYEFVPEPFCVSVLAVLMARLCQRAGRAVHP